MAVRLFRRCYDRRALPLADRVIAGDQTRACTTSVDDDGRVAGDEFHRQFPRRMARQLLEPDGEAGVFSAHRGNRRARRRGYLRDAMAAAWHIAEVIRRRSS